MAGEEVAGEEVAGEEVAGEEVAEEEVAGEGLVRVAMMATGGAVEATVGVAHGVVGASS